MALASFGASTPFITRTPSSAVIFASPTADGKFGLTLGLGVGVGFGLAAADPPFALLVFTALSFAVFASLLPAMTGTAVIASTRKLNNHHLFTSNMDGGS
jgi:hypothetical protein